MWPFTTGFTHWALHNWAKKHCPALNGYMANLPSCMQYFPLLQERDTDLDPSEIQKSNEKQTLAKNQAHTMEKIHQFHEPRKKVLICACSSTLLISSCCLLLSCSCSSVRFGSESITKLHNLLGSVFTLFISRATSEHICKQLVLLFAFWHY